MMNKASAFIVVAAVALAGCVETKQEAATTTQADTLPMTGPWAMRSLAAALAVLSPIEAAGVLTEAGWDCLPYPSSRQGWIWTAPTTGAPVDHYVVRWEFAVRDTTFAYWLADDCQTMSVQVAGVDSLGRVGIWSNPGVCE